MSKPIVRLSQYIASEWLTVNDQAWTDDINPSDATEVLARIPSGDATVVDRAAEAAHSGFERWRTASGPERAEVLHRTANLLVHGFGLRAGDHVAIISPNSMEYLEIVSPAAKPCAASDAPRCSEVSRKAAKVMACASSTATA